MPIRRLPDHLANRIAAGEVVERPASTVKELVENALDAGARRVEIAIRGGGRDLIEVSDDGSGMPPEDLALAVERHATSKLPGDDLLDIRSLGFRGEALPSIGSVSHLTITSRAEGHDAAAIVVENGQVGEVRPAARAAGTRIRVEGLFRAFPARLKFLKSDRAETDAVVETVRRLAATRPDVDFALDADGRQHRFAAHGTDAEALRRRLAEVLGREFGDNSTAVDQSREGFRIHGRVGIPTFNRATAAHQLMIVNGRPVRDRLLIGALRGAYQDLMPRDRHSVVALYFEVDPQEVDVNVHPAKSEVRFRDAGLARALMISAIRAALAGAPRSATTGADFALSAFRAEPASAYAPGPAAPFLHQHVSRQWPQASATGRRGGFAEAQAAFEIEPSADRRADADREGEAMHAEARPLGVAKAQIHDTYILAQNADGMVLVDMHAAHERIVLERLKRSRAAGHVARQGLLVPEIVELGTAEADLLLASADELAGFGLAIECFGPGAIIVREVPAALGDFDVASLVRDLADGLREWGAALPLAERLDRLSSTFACHHSIRAGRRLKPEEMDALLRQIEEEPLAAQCNHGRPTYVTLTRSDLERLFHRR